MPLTLCHGRVRVRAAQEQHRLFHQLPCQMAKQCPQQTGVSVTVAKLLTRTRQVAEVVQNTVSNAYVINGTAIEDSSNRRHRCRALVIHRQTSRLRGDLCRSHQPSITHTRSDGKTSASSGRRSSKKCRENVAYCSHFQTMRGKCAARLSSCCEDEEPQARDPDRSEHFLHSP